MRKPAEVVHRFAAAMFAAHDVPRHDAELCADVLVSADLRGIRSHGVARLPYFSTRLERGVINATPDIRLEQRSDTTCNVDADNGLGAVASAKAMEQSIAMARAHGSGFATVTHSNHFGYAGYWADQAMRQGFIGIAMANSGRRVTPTFGSESLLGTNPLAVGIPGGEATADFLLDMATSTVAVGKIETSLRENRPVPAGWLDETHARPSLDERGTLTYDAPLLPLGGAGDTTGGHKGYGLSLMVELLCGALAGTALSSRLGGAAGESAAEMGQFFGAIRIDGFRSPDEVAADMASTFETLRSAAKAPDHDTVYIHGEPEQAAEEENRRSGLPITPLLLEQMRTLNRQLDLGFEL